MYSIAAIDESRFVAGTEYGSLLFFHHDRGDYVSVVQSLPNVHTSWAPSIAMHGRRIVTGSGDVTSKVWDANTWDLCGTLCGHTSLISDDVLNGVAMSEKHIAITVDDLVYIWDDIE